MDPIICSNCGADIPNDSPSCNSCGTPTRSPQRTDGFCTNCGSQLTDKYARCPQCGYTKTIPNPHNTPPPNPSSGTQSAMYKNEGTTIVLAVVLGLLGLNGIGHIYIRKIVKGIVLLIGSIILYGIGVVTIIFGVGIVLLIVYIIIFIWQIFNAKNLCKEYNDHIRAHGVPPADW